jgi:arylformamidase
MRKLLLMTALLVSLTSLAFAEKGWQDLSIAITPRTPIYPGNAGLEYRWMMRLEKGDICNLSAMSLGVHTGTHVDAPLHFIARGASVDQIAFSALVGRGRIIECSPDARVIDAAELNKHEWRGSKRLLFKTRNSFLGFMGDPKFHRDFTYIAPDAARLLAEAGVRLVGVDYLSIEKFGAKKAETHLILLGHGIPIIEGLDLRKAEAGDYDLICMPMKLGGREAAPARVMVRPFQSAP